MGHRPGLGVLVRCSTSAVRSAARRECNAASQVPYLPFPAQRPVSGESTPSSAYPRPCDGAAKPTPGVEPGRTTAKPRGRNECGGWKGSPTLLMVSRPIGVYHSVRWNRRSEPAAHLL